MSGDDEAPLPGGFVNQVVRIGATVRRSPTARSPFVHRLLELFERRAWPGAPRYLGVDARGREILDHIDGRAALTEDERRAARSDAALARVAEMVRAFHDLTSGSPLAEGHEVVCHNDLSPKNTVYAVEDGAWHPVAFIDWDIAAPGARVHDVAHVCWQYLDLGPGTADIPEAARRIGLIRDAYGLADSPSDLLEAILWWQDRCRRGIEAGAADGDRAMIRLTESGVPGRIRSAHQWVATHRRAITQP
ncbi:phosphotransferase, partial [Streptomyces sp. SBT349]|uniref:phosphotransferase n=1 Tax=Streptomyces sp. SBT349 TaxID=1580539 RepID=UPI0007C7D2EB